MVTINENLEIIELRSRLDDYPNGYVALCDLSQNFLPYLENLFPFWSQNISILKLNNCFCAKIARFAFNDLVNVETLHLDNNCLKKLPAELFETCWRLRSLSLRNNQFRSFQVACFQGAPALRELDLSDNLLTSVRSCSMNYLEVLNLSRNQISIFICNQFEKLLVLNLSWNKLEGFNSCLSKNMHSLTDVDFSHNQISIMKPSTFELATKLKTLRLNSNCFRKFTTKILARNCQLKCLELDDNQLKTLFLEDELAIHLETLSLAHNLNCKFERFGMLVNLKRVNFSGSSFHADYLPQLCNSKALDHFNFADNRVHKIPNGYFANLTKLTFLSLENSEPECLSGLTEPLFRPDNSLKRLTMSGCGLENVTSFFRFLTHLTYLNLARNKIVELDPRTFVDLTQLKHLSLNRNELTGFQPQTFRTLINLKTVDLTANPFNEINRSLFENCLGLNRLFLDEGVEVIN